MAVRWTCFGRPAPTTETRFRGNIDDVLPTAAEIHYLQQLAIRYFPRFRGSPIEGAFAAQAAWGEFFIKAAFGGVRTPDDVSAGFTAIVEAAAAPARRKVRANARRLTGAKASL